MPGHYARGQLAGRWRRHTVSLRRIGPESALRTPYSAISTLLTRAAAAAADQRLRPFALPTTCSTCARETRNCRAMVARFTPASNAARMTFA